MSVELDHILSSRRADSNSSVPSKASSLPLHSAIEQCPRFVHVLDSRFHCESSAITIVYTSVLESQVSYRYAGVESFSYLDHDQLRDLRICVQIFSSVAGLAQIRGSST